MIEWLQDTKVEIGKFLIAIFFGLLLLVLASNERSTMADYLLYTLVSPFGAAIGFIIAHRFIEGSYYAYFAGALGVAIGVPVIIGLIRLGQTLKNDPKSLMWWRK